MAAPVPATTKIIGFQNQNSWPVHVANNLLGISQTLHNKGDYVCDREGLKVNDPRLMQYVGSNMLTVHMGEAEIPVHTMPMSTHEATTRHGFGGTRTVPEVSTQKGVPKLPVKNEKEKPPTAVISPATTRIQDVEPAGLVKSQWGFGMSMEQARKLGLAGNSKPIPEDHGVVDTEGALLNGQQIPDISTPRYPRPKVQTDLSAFVQGEAIMPPASEEISDAPVKVAVDGFAMPEMPRAEPLLEESETDAPAAEPEPEPTMPSTAVHSESQGAVRFVDPETQRGFKYRSQLARFVQKKYPKEKADAIMSAYPATA